MYKPITHHINKLHWPSIAHYNNNQHLRHTQTNNLLVDTRVS